MKKYLSLFLIVVLALAIIGTAGVVAVPKAAAAPSDYKPINVQYKVGKTYSFTPARFTSHVTQLEAPVGTPSWTAFSDKGTASSSITLVEGQKGLAEAYDTMQWRVTQKNGFTDADLTKTCTITITFSYAITTSGDTIADIEYGPGISVADDQIIYVIGQDALHSKTGTITQTFTLTLDKVFEIFDNELRGGVRVGAETGTDHICQLAGSASATASVDSVTLTFN